MEEDFEVGPAAERGPPPEFNHPLIDEVLGVTRQTFNCICMVCPLAHWEAMATDPPEIDAPLPTPGKASAHWALVGYCRVRHADVAKFVPDDDRPGKLKRSALPLIFRCSDQALAVEQWQASQD